MTALELKVLTEKTEPYFFTRKTMSFFGDTIKNYGVCSAIVNTYTRQGIKCWELYRRLAVKHGLQSSAYFDKKTLKRVFTKNHNEV